MPRCTITRTHRYGQKLSPKDWPAPVLGPVFLQTARSAALNRSVSQLTIIRPDASEGHVIPPLCDPQILSMSSDQGMMVAGFEEIGGRRYYQGWYIRWDG